MASRKPKVTHKWAVLKLPYQVNFGGYDITVPIGTQVTNSTACGNDDNYRFVANTEALADLVVGKGKDVLLRHDLKYRGLNVPEEFCEPYAS